MTNRVLYTQCQHFAYNSCFYFQLASTFNIDFFETSCKTDVNVDAAFQLLSMKIKEVQEAKVGFPFIDFFFIYKPTTV